MADPRLTGLADSHVHLHAYPDPGALIGRAAAAGVERVVGVSVDLDSSRATLRLARDFPNVVAAVGIHPSHLEGPLSEETLAGLEALAEDPLTGFVGEIGLDAVEARVPLATQIEAFETQLRLARKLGRPVNLHLRGAFDEALAILDDPNRPAGVVHYFVGDSRLARRFLDRGLLISVGKPVIRAENQALRAAIRDVPLDCLLLETDSYPLPGRTTEPRDVVQVARAVAELKGISSIDVARATATNLTRALGKERGYAA